MTIRSRMTSVMELIRPELSKLSALELENLPYLPEHPELFTNINQSVPNLVTMNMSIRSQMSLIMIQVIPDQSVLSALEIEKLIFSSLFGIYLHC